MRSEMPNNTNNKHSEQWRFARLGGFDQVEISRNSDFDSITRFESKIMGVADNAIWRRC
jgi:hypothetical protein